MCSKRYFLTDRKRGNENILHFEGIDTLAEIYLNGEKIACCENMHIVVRVSKESCYWNQCLRIEAHNACPQLFDLNEIC